jgi:hypothetical protein
LSFGNLVYIDEHIIDTGQSGMTNFGAELHLGRNTSRNLNDNGFYNLEGQSYVDYAIHYAGDGDDEPMVNNAYINIETLVVIGHTGGCIRHGSAEYTRIGKLVAEAPHGTAPEDVWENVPRGMIIHRSTAYDRGETIIDWVEGTFYGLLIATGNSSGTTSKLKIGGGNINMIWRSPAIETSLSYQNWFNLNGCLSFDIKNLSINIIDRDDVITSNPAEYFIQQHAGITSTSVMENVDVYIKASDGTPSPFGVYRGQGDNEFISVKGARWQNNVGPYVRNADYNGGDRDSFSTSPSIGYFKKGATFTNNSVTGDWAYRITATGNPCTFEALT